jgi:hypothetical protein
MPRPFTWSQLLWTGIVLIIVGLAARLYLASLVFALGGNDAINNVLLVWAQTLLGQVAFGLGIALVSLLGVVRATRAKRGLTRTFWIGVGLIVCGLVLQSSITAWQWDLSGATDVGRSLARDVLWVVGAPLEAVAVPLGTLLVAGSVVARSFGALGASAGAGAGSDAAGERD